MILIHRSTVKREGRQGKRRLETLRQYNLKNVAGRYVVFCLANNVVISLLRCIGFGRTDLANECLLLGVRKRTLEIGDDIIQALSPARA